MLNWSGRSLTNGLTEPLPFLEAELDLVLGIFNPRFICLTNGLALVSVISSDDVENSLNLEDIDFLSKDERPEGGRRLTNLILFSVEDRLEVDLDVSELLL